MLSLLHVVKTASANVILILVIKLTWKLLNKLTHTGSFFNIVAYNTNFYLLLL
jgi:hypothetical protein